MRGLRSWRLYAFGACVCIGLLGAQVSSEHACAHGVDPGTGGSSGSDGSVRVPILMYHYIRVNPVAQDRAGADLSVTPRDFTLQMQLLVATGFQSISLDDLTAALTSGRALPPRPVVLTFDDGYED